MRSIDELARLAGVAKSTVSRALNDSPLVGAETKAKILALAKAHGFTPSAIARNLSTRTSRTIAFVAHAYEQGKCCGISDPFSLEILGGITQGLHEAGYDLLVVNINPSDRDWAEAYLNSGRVDGFILMTSTRKRDHLETLLSLGAPFIAWGLPGKAEYSTVCGEDRKGGRLGMEHLLDRGRRRVAILAGPKAETEVQERLLGAEEALDARGLAFDKGQVVHGDYTEKDGARAMADLLQRHPRLDALVCHSDLMAIAAMKVLAASGRRVPDDVAVLGYDDLSLARYASPSLSTISQSVPLGGRYLARDLVAYLETRVVSHSRIPVGLVLREST